MSLRDHFFPARQKCRRIRKSSPVFIFLWQASLPPAGLFCLFLSSDLPSGHISALLRPCYLSFWIYSAAVSRKRRTLWPSIRGRCHCAWSGIRAPVVICCGCFPAASRGSPFRAAVRWPSRNSSSTATDPGWPDSCKSCRRIRRGQSPGQSGRSLCFAVNWFPSIPITLAGFALAAKGYACAIRRRICGR